MRRVGPRSVARTLGDAVLAVLACAGAVCIGLVVAALVFNVSIMLFATGSMSPTIPAGSAALVREIPASEVRVGDVVTVDRPGLLPVTHRVVAIDEAPSGGAGHVALTLRGDANPVDDPAPYDVATVRVVLWSVPGAAAIIAGLGDPLVLGSLTVAMSALVLWSFWPRDPDGGRRRRTGAGAPGRHAVASMARGASGTGVVVLLATAAAIAAPSPPARAEPGEQVIRGRYIVLTTVADPVRMTTLSPGDTASLLLGVGTVPEAPGVVTLTLDVDAVDTALALRVVECDGPPVDGSCPDGRVVLAGLPLDAPSAGIALGEVPGHAGRWLRFDVSAPSSGLAQGARAELVVHARGFGEIVETGAGGADFASGPLATSGTDASSRVLLAAGVVAMGIVAASIGRRRLRRRRRGRGDGGLA